jgi:hypothetical protein
VAPPLPTDARAAHIGFVAKSEAEVNAFYEAAMAAGATNNGKPGPRPYYNPRYYAANVFDPRIQRNAVIFAF